MVTATRTDGNNVIATFTFKGRSSDTKPVGKWEGTIIKNGSAYLSIDTQEVVFYDQESESWN